MVEHSIQKTYTETQMEFKISPKGCRYVDGKKVSVKRYEELEKECSSFDTFHTIKKKDGYYHYKFGRKS